MFNTSRPKVIKFLLEIS